MIFLFLFCFVLFFIRLDYILPGSSGVHFIVFGLGIDGAFDDIDGGGRRR